jgi:hypothetical protein
LKSHAKLIFAGRYYNKKDNGRIKDAEIRRVTELFMPINGFIAQIREPSSTPPIQPDIARREATSPTITA